MLLLENYAKSSYLSKVMNFPMVIKEIGLRLGAILKTQGTKCEQD